MAGQFHDGLTIVFTAATLMALTAAMASLSRGRHQRAVPADDTDAADTRLAEATR